MIIPEKYDRVITGLLSGFILPLLIGLIVFLFSAGEMSPGAYLSRLKDSNIITHSITLCVFPNIFVFLLYNRLDMLRATRGVLAITIIWAMIVFSVKFLT
jgi:hypothetical protein